MPEVTHEVASEFLLSATEPFVLTKELVATLPERYLVGPTVDALIAPLRWESDGFGAIVLAPEGHDAPFTEQAVRRARGIADITSLALGNARRFHELERFHELVEGLEAIFWEADAATLQFSFLSHGARSILDRPVADWLMKARFWGEHIHPKDRRRATTDLRTGTDGGGDFQLEYRAVGKDGERMWMRDIVRVVPERPDEPAQLRGLIIDVTERKRAEQALRKSEQTYSEAFKREREATRRLRALDEMKNTFLEAVSHELRTPLTAILGSALTLEGGSGISADDASDLVNRIAANARKLERLLSDLLDLDRLQRGIVTPQRRDSDVGELVRRAVRDSGVPAERHVDVEAERIVAFVDPAKVERIVENLVANAIRHTPPDSRVWVRVERAGDGVMIAVDDEGAGVPDELKEQVFEAFRQGMIAAGPSPGVGVGLSLVSRFAELHGGRAWVEDRPGGGASFRVLLPGDRTAEGAHRPFATPPRSSGLARENRPAGASREPGGDADNSPS